jgi:hypothetical protein
LKNAEESRLDPAEKKDDKGSCKDRALIFEGLKALQQLPKEIKLLNISHVYC